MRVYDHCKSIFHVLYNTFLGYFSKNYLREEFVTIWPGDIGGGEGGVTSIVTNGDMRGGGPKFCGDVIFEWPLTVSLFLEDYFY